VERFDYVIVGAGPAGCVLANRLSHDPGRRVLLLESGPPDQHPLIHMPKGVGKIRANSRYVWAYDRYEHAEQTQPSQQWMRGRTLGGSSAINGLIYVRGQPQDYQELGAETSAAWGWEAMRGAFDALESPADRLPGASPDGRLKITPYQGDSGDATLLHAAIQAGQSLGLEHQRDVNHPDDQAKIGYAQRTIDAGRRQSAAVAFLRPAEQRRNLKVVTGVLVDRVLFEADQAVGVECLVGGLRQRYYGARIILSAGSIGSPAILQRSGVGDPKLLEALGIPVVVSAPQVGQNMREHTCLNLQWRAVGHSNNHRYQGVGALRSGLQYYLRRSGPLANAIFEVTGLFRTSPQAERPNAQLFFGPHSFTDSSHKTRTPEKLPGFMVCTFPVRPRSTGSVCIDSRDAQRGPRIVFDPFSDPQDRREMVDAVRFVRRLVASEPLARYVVEETRPGRAHDSDEAILDSWRRLSGPVFHATGTCRMGADEASVVDPDTRVRGVRNLHVVDLSIAPRVLAAATYGPVCALAWRAADLLMSHERSTV
jgi:choline dehydrogenase